jgi:hypothetical protein
LLIALLLAHRAAHRAILAARDRRHGQIVASDRQVGAYVRHDDSMSAETSRGRRPARVLRLACRFTAGPVGTFQPW